MKKSFQIPPNAVRIWRGFRAPTLSQQDFFKRLKQTFVPSTVEMQIKNGLDVYIPTIPAGLKGKPASVPDETAILFWDSQQTYHDGFNTLAGRTYTLTHGGVYTHESTADFPVLYKRKLQLNTCYFLINKSADWMHGKVQHLVAAVPTGSTSDVFKKYEEILTGIQERGAVDGAIVCVGASYIVYWQLNGVNDPGFKELAKASGWQMTRKAKPYKFPKNSALWDDWPGMDIVPGDSFNMQFTRAFEKTAPKPVAPDSVHVWRGYRSKDKNAKEFADFLGQVFLPTGSLLQPGAGLHAFVPSLPENRGKPKYVPDQTALMFWTSPKAYKDGFKKVAVRAYTNLHGDLYDTTISKSGFPIYLSDEVKAEQPYFLINKPADWMLGRIHHYVGAKPKKQSTKDFLALIYKWASDIRDNPPAGLDGGLICAGKDYVVVWLLWDMDATANDPIKSLAKATDSWLDMDAEQYVLPAGLWDDWSGIDQSYPNSKNIQLNRP